MDTVVPLSVSTVGLAGPYDEAYVLEIDPYEFAPALYEPLRAVIHVFCLLLSSSGYCSSKSENNKNTAIQIDLKADFLEL